MRICYSAFFFASATSAAFVGPQHQQSFVGTTTRLHGYLDDLSADLYAEADEPDAEDLYEGVKMKEEDKDRFGVGNWDEFVEFEEFDGGDGQMGVAGDGKKGLDKEWKGASQMAKSKFRSARNAWGTSTGYADKLIDDGVEATRAQQLENWHNQQEVINARKGQRFLTEEFDQVSDASWRDLASFGVERNQDFDLDATFGAVEPGDITGVIELSTRINRNEVYEFQLKNNFMGFSDFRARFVPDNGDWKVEPDEGSINGKSPTDFLVKFRPSNPGTSQSYLVIETEDDKWTYQCMGTSSM